MIHMLTKYEDGQQLLLIGHFTEQEIMVYKLEGYRLQQFNKHGIAVDY